MKEYQKKVEQIEKEYLDNIDIIVKQIEAEQSLLPSFNGGFSSKLVAEHDKIYTKHTPSMIELYNAKNNKLAKLKKEYNIKD